MNAMTRMAMPLAAAFLLAACQTFSLAPTGKPVELANAYTVTPSQSWNLFEDGKIQTWTLDGPVLQQVQFFNGIETGDPLFKALSSDQDKKPPAFESGMSPLEVRDMFVATRARLNSITLTTSGLRPEPFGGDDGSRFEYAFTDPNGIEKRGFVKSTIRDGKLFLIDYSAVALYYYERDLPAVERLVESLRDTAA